jgi:hypothetical protein
LEKDAHQAGKLSISQPLMLLWREMRQAARKYKESASQIKACRHPVIPI